MKDLAQESANRRSTRGETQEKEDFAVIIRKARKSWNAFPFPKIHSHSMHLIGLGD